jgi:hypothetical protein
MMLFALTASAIATGEAGAAPAAEMPLKLMTMANAIAPKTDRMMSS